jgi:hypothetical protein
MWVSTRSAFRIGDKNIGHLFLCALTISIAICGAGKSLANSDQSRIPDLQKKLGVGWQCFAIPQGIDQVGVIIEQQADKSVFYVDDLKESNIVSGLASVGSLTTSTQFSLGAAIKLISTFFPSLNVSYDYNKKTSILISDAEERAGGSKVSQDGVVWAQKHVSSFKPGSRLFVIREELLAAGVTYTFDKSTATKIAADLQLSEPKTASALATPGTGQKSQSNKGASGAKPTDSPITPSGTTPSNAGSQPEAPANKTTSTLSPPKAGQQIAQTFNPKIGICIHPDEIVLGNSYAGNPRPHLQPVVGDLGFK